MGSHSVGIYNILYLKVSVSSGFLGFWIFTYSYKFYNLGKGVVLWGGGGGGGEQ